MKNADPLAPIAIGRHSDSPTTKASAINPVTLPMSATPNSHLAVFRVEYLNLSLLFDAFCVAISICSQISGFNRNHVTRPLTHSQTVGHIHGFSAL